MFQCDPAFTAANEAKVTPLAIAIFLKYNSDPVLVNLVQDVLRVLSQTEGCLQPLQQRLVPTLVSILDASEDKVAMGLKAVALDVLEILVRGSKSKQQQQHSLQQAQNGNGVAGQQTLSELLMGSAFPAAVRCTLAADDNSIMQVREINPCFENVQLLKKTVISNLDSSDILHAFA